MGIRRTALPFEADYVQIPNAWLRDEAMSRRARGLLAELMTHKPGWHITIASLQARGPEGRDAIRSAIAELVARGYLTVRQEQGAGGKFVEVEYLLNDPNRTAVGFPDSGSTGSGRADVGESAPKKNKTQKTIDREHERGAEAPSPFCSRHPNGTEQKCGPCGTARERLSRWQDERRSRPTLLPRLSDTRMCDDHPEYPIERDGSCTKCARIAAETRGAA